MPIREFTRSLVCCWSGWLLLVTAPPASASTPHYVFAHYMVCYSDYGATIQGYEQDIRDAQAAGVDGFALDMPEWNGPDWYYTNNCDLM
jgi:glucan endo-1,3-alpha-glucosidase